MTKATITLIPARSIPKAIKDIHSRGQSLQADMHQLACSVLSHLGKTKDIRHTLAFLQAMPEMSRANSMRQWFEAYGPIRFPTAEEKKAGAPEAMFVKDKKTLLGDAMANPFWKFKATEGVAYEPVDVAAQIKQLIARLEKDQTKAKAAGKTVNHSATIAQLRALTPQAEIMH